MDDPLMTTPEAEDYVRRKGLARGRVEGWGPDYIKLGRLVRYRKSALDAWIAKQQRKNTAQDATPRG